MATEIELKAWVDNPEMTMNALGVFAQPRTVYEKKDCYWRISAGSRGQGNQIERLGSGVRIRLQRSVAFTGSQAFGRDAFDIAVRRLLDEGKNRDDHAIITYKSKELRTGIEINDEKEFTVDNPDAFAELLGRLGLSEGPRKRKIGFSWTTGEATLELSHVEGLGLFLEIEIIAEDAEESTVHRARGRLLELLDQAGIDRQRIETRYYTEMLQGENPR